MNRLAIVAVLACACSGAARETDEPDDTPGTGGGAGKRAAGKGGASAGASGSAGAGVVGGTNFSAAPARLHLLTTLQYRQAVADLLGAATDRVSLAADIVSNGFTNTAATEISVSGAAVAAFDAAARELVTARFADAGARGSLSPCAPANAQDAACARRFVERFGRRAFRRPLTTTEIDRYTGVFTKVAPAAQDVWQGLAFAAVGMLNSPHFLYQVELGEPDPAARDRRRLTAWEFATRMSFALWNTTPDDALLTAAERGELDRASSLSSTVDRLLASDRTRATVRHFFTELYALPGDTIEKDATTFPQLASRPTLGRSMREETLRTIEDLVFNRDADVLELLDGRVTFVDASLAELYGVQGDGRVELPADGPRGGLLTHASILATLATTTETNPTKRGKFIREKLLCETVPLPPPEVEMGLPDAPGMALTKRDKLAVHAKTPACAGCHKLLDPPGLALERFDAIGVYREREKGLVIETKGTFDDVSFDDARGLGRALRGRTDVQTCLVRQLFRYATGHVEEQGEEKAIVALSERFGRDGRKLRGAMAALLTSEAYRAVASPP